MKNICELYKKEFSSLPEKVMQFGEGNFLRSFADWYIDEANKKNVFCSSIVIVQPRGGGHCDKLDVQDSFYTLVMRGRDKDKIINESTRISSISRTINPFKNKNELIDFAKSKDLSVVISNTTEAGIEYISDENFDDFPNVSYPAKLTRVLFERYNEKLNGLLILPVELIEDNGDVLKECVLKYAKDWNFDSSFFDYINNDCYFASTLVDRIVTGFPKNDYKKIIKELGYADNLLETSEPYNSWIIKADKKWKKVFPIDKINDNVKWVDDLSQYRTRKVRILNGAHTVSVLSAYLSGFDIVRDMMNDKDYFSFVKNCVYEEIIPTINMDKDELTSFALSVFDRFNNPFIDHKLLDISLNSVSKFKARCLDTIFDYINIKNSVPKLLLFGFASLIKFYDGEYVDEKYIAKRGNDYYQINDSKEVLEIINNAYKSDDVVYTVLTNKTLWGQDLTKIDVLYNEVKNDFELINNTSMKDALLKVNTYE